MTDRRRRV